MITVRVMENSRKRSDEKNETDDKQNEMQRLTRLTAYGTYHIFIHTSLTTQSI